MCFIFLGKLLKRKVKKRGEDFKVFSHIASRFAFPLSTQVEFIRFRLLVLLILIDFFLLSGEKRKYIEFIIEKHSRFTFPSPISCSISSGSKLSLPLNF